MGSTQGNDTFDVDTFVTHAWKAQAIVNSRLVFYCYFEVNEAAAGDHLFWTITKDHECKVTAEPYDACEVECPAE